MSVKSPEGCIGFASDLTYRSQSSADSSVGRDLSQEAINGEPHVFTYMYTRYKYTFTYTICVYIYMYIYICTYSAHMQVCTDRKMGFFFSPPETALQDILDHNVFGQVCWVTADSEAFDSLEPCPRIQSCAYIVD